LGCSLLGLGGALAWNAREARADGATGLDPKNFHPFELSDVKNVNYNTKLFTFKVPGQDKLPVSSFILTKAPLKDKDGKDLTRPYTPLTPLSKDEIRLLVKIYPDGQMAKHLETLQVGDKLEIKGPLPKIPYAANTKKEIGMVAGGTGLTPMLQVIEEILHDPNDKTKVTLLFANTTEKDILLKEKLDKLAATHKNFQVYYIVDKPSSSWKGFGGHVSKDVLGKILPNPKLGKETLVYVCGPPGFYKAVSGEKNMKDYSQGELSGILKELGYNESQVFKF